MDVWIFVFHIWLVAKFGYKVPVNAQHIFYIFQWLVATLAALKNWLKSTGSSMEHILHCCEVPSPKKNSKIRRI
jgi:hypothetical protein